VQISRRGHAESGPWAGEALVAFGSGSLPHRGAFSLDLPSGLFLTGFRVGEHEVINLRGHLDGRPLDLPSWSLLFLSRGLPSVAAGPADPGAWEILTGNLGLPEGEAEAQARDRKAASLPGEVAALYQEARPLREAGRLDGDRLRMLKVGARKHPDEWLLLEEVAELEAMQ
jgi:phenylalanine-4-hydroxylase